MAIEIKVPLLPESVTDATVLEWHKQVGDSVKVGDNLVDLETDKVMLEIPATDSGVLTATHVNVGDTVIADQLLVTIDEQAPVVESQSANTTADQPVTATEQTTEKVASPSVRRALEDHDLDINEVQSSGKGGRVTKADVENHLSKTDDPVNPSPVMTSKRAIKREKMTRIRAKIAERLKQVQQETAMLTTFNEVNMQPIMDLRANYQDVFQKKHGVKLGFMSFFVKAVAHALKAFPRVNATIEGNDVLYYNYYDIGVAVSTDRGLMVPVLRDADTMTMAMIENQIIELATKARNNKIALEDMQGGTFTITNGGIFGSMLSTPILNAPQSAILGMHNITKRAVVVNDEIVIKPMMYLALTYDHRIIDGEQSVKFLVKIKQMLEDPNRFVLDV
ncbi:MAG: dihydrolipoyllysine-residue succinyltransferase [Legionellales bacterium]|nr:dihydrolipoyllysine-residue succinyltransferase [Legionellales bacterium]